MVCRSPHSLPARTHVALRLAVPRQPVESPRHGPLFIYIGRRSAPHFLLITVISRRTAAARHNIFSATFHFLGRSTFRSVRTTQIGITTQLDRRRQKVETIFVNNKTKVSAKNCVICESSSVSVKSASRADRSLNFIVFASRNSAAASNVQILIKLVNRAMARFCLSCIFSRS